MNAEPQHDLLTRPGRVALVGAGAFGRFCINSYRAAGDFEIVEVADPDESALNRVNAPGAHLTPDWRSAVSGDAEVIQVATPPHLRSEVVFAALTAGKSVFCEKPLAISLQEADAMIDLAQQTGVAIGVDYVMRHQPAYRVLEQFAHSGIFGALRSFSFQNFAQALSPHHWFWDENKSGGIFVEHGVHFFDAYGRIAGVPSQVSASAPRREAVEATVLYATDVVGRFYHEFAFPSQVERTVGTSFFERGYVEIEGWIPTRLSGAVLAAPESLRSLGQDTAGLALRQEGGVTRFEVEFPDRELAYRAAVVSGMRDVIRRHRDYNFELTVPIADARASLALALACQQSIHSGTPVYVIDV
jgi:predicted dehydrogenase